MTLDIAAAVASVRQLRHAGLRPSDALARSIVKGGDASITPLVELATSIDMFDEDEPACYAPLHALRMLGELPRVSMIAPLLDQFPIEIYEEGDQLRQAWSTEVPQMIGRLGAAAIAPLWAIFDGPAQKQAARGIAVVALACVTVIAPDERAPLIDALHERLEQADDTFACSCLVLGLARLGIADDYRRVMALYRDGQLDKAILPAANARQLLLNGGDKTLDCTVHTITERYDQHGPYPVDE